MREGKGGGECFAWETKRVEANGVGGRQQWGGNVEREDERIQKEIERE